MSRLGTRDQLLHGAALAVALVGMAVGARAAEPIDATPIVTYLHHFQGADGSDPRGGLIRATDGNYYGTTFAGGAKDAGVVFRMTPQGALTVIHDFPAHGDDGPETALVQGSDGFLYGTTATDTNGVAGSVFRVALDGAFETLHRLTPDEGAFLVSELIESRDGFLYGTAFVGGDDNAGTVFRVSRTGAFERLVSFPGTGDMGRVPQAPLLEGDDGNFYGTTTRGGAFDSGTLFRVTPTGELTTLRDFDFWNDGGAPAGRLVPSADHSAVQGVAQAGGAYGAGTAYAFEVASGTFAKLADFPAGVGWVPTGLTPGRGRETYYFFMLTSRPEHGELMALPADDPVRHVVDVKGHTAPCPPTRMPDGALLGVLESGGKGGNGGIFRISGP